MAGSRKRGVVIQSRDRHLLSELAVMRTIDREMTKVVAGFGTTTQVNKRLLELTRAGLLRRFFVGTISSGRKSVYTLSVKGAEIVAARRRAVLKKITPRLFALVATAGIFQLGDASRDFHDL